jgi:putative endonuclease
MAYVKFRFASAKERSVESRQEAKEFGETGEQMAARYLEEQGYVSLDRNYRRGHKEVDIIALDHGELAVVEVKTRTSEGVFAAEQAVDHRKRQNIIRVANNYMRRYHRTEPLRFDIIAIVGSGVNAEIRHTKNAFNVFSY